MTRLPNWRQRRTAPPPASGRTLLRGGAVGLAFALGATAMTACDSPQHSLGFVDNAVPSFSLAAFDSCDQALTNLRSAAKAVVGPYGLWSAVYTMEKGMPVPAAADAAGAPNSRSAAPSYTGTNNYEANADEPDLVKTDGHRIVVISNGTLRIIDPVSHHTTASISLADQQGPGYPAGAFMPTNLLLFGDHALVFAQTRYFLMDDRVSPPPIGNAGGGTVSGSGGTGSTGVEASAAPGQPGPSSQPGSGAPDAPQSAPASPVPANPIPAGPPPITGPEVILLDLSGAPRVIATAKVDGNLLDARQTGSQVRVVVNSVPRLEFPTLNNATDEQRIAANKAAIDAAPLKSWLPRIEITNRGATRASQIPCSEISRPSSYSGTNLLTVLSFDLAADGLSDGQPTTLVADGNLIYSNGASLYVASDQRWLAMPASGIAPQQIDAKTAIYKFDAAKPGRPHFIAGGVVPGYLLNQYSMSEWNGNLRVATTTEQVWSSQGPGKPSQSGVYVLGQSGDKLRQLGGVTGLGKGERIFAVRFVGAVGYVVTFKRTDPLYTVDLSNPSGPKVVGELKLPGYSAYLHPVAAGRLIGVGQNADANGRVTGTQVSLFDVTDTANPQRIANFHTPDGSSEAEFDPHAFLYSAEDGLLVLPLQVYAMVSKPGAVPGGTPVPPVVSSPTPIQPKVGAVLLRVSDTGMTEVGFINQPGTPVYGGYYAPIRRSLIIDGTLWTVSDGGVMGTDVNTLRTVAWIPFS